MYQWARYLYRIGRYCVFLAAFFPWSLAMLNFNKENTQYRKDFVMNNKTLVFLVTSCFINFTKPSTQLR